MELSKARSILTVKDLEIWHKYTEDGLVVFNRKFRECFLLFLMDRVKEF